jgi:hypothetical protein
MGSGAVRHVVAPEPSRAKRWAPEPQEAWRHQSPPEPGARASYRRTSDSTSMHALLLALAWSLYTGVPDLQGADTMIIYQLFQNIM